MKKSSLPPQHASAFTDRLADEDRFATARFGRLPDYFRLDWDATKFFYVVAKVGAFQKAGQVLRLSQSALTRKIQNLEDHLGVILFHRQSRGVHVTNAGADLYTRVEAIMQIMRGFFFERSDETASPLRVAVAPELWGVPGFSQRLVLALSQSPALSVDTVPLPPEVALPEADVLIVPEQPMSAFEQGWIRQPWMTLTFGVFVHASYRAGGAMPTTLTALKEHPLLVAGPYEHCQERAIDFSGPPLPPPHPGLGVRYRSPHVPSALEAARQGLGLLVAPCEGFDAPTQGFERLLPEVILGTCRLALVYPEHAAHDARLLALLNSFRHHEARESNV